MIWEAATVCMPHFLMMSDEIYFLLRPRQLREFKLAYVDILRLARGTMICVKLSRFSLLCGGQDCARGGLRHDALLSGTGNLEALARED